MALRGYHRQRQMQIRYAASHVQHMQKALEQMNVKLTEVLADLTGLTGRRIIEAILAGEPQPRAPAALGKAQSPHAQETLPTALAGAGRPGDPVTLPQAGRLP